MGTGRSRQSQGTSRRSRWPGLPGSPGVHGPADTAPSSPRSSTRSRPGKRHRWVWRTPARRSSLSPRSTPRRTAGGLCAGARSDPIHRSITGWMEVSVLRLINSADAVSVHYGQQELFSYVYQPDSPQLESPRPYFHPVHTLGGQPVTLFRPEDHVWHKGIAWSLPNVGTENFWG